VAGLKANVVFDRRGRRRLIRLLTAGRNAEPDQADQQEPAASPDLAARMVCLRSIRSMRATAT
jgi:hypothetical protein